MACTLLWMKLGAFRYFAHKPLMASEFRPPSDKEIDAYGAMFAADVFGFAILNASLLVVQIVLVLYGVSGFFATPKDRRKGRLRFIIISVLMVGMCIIDICFDLWKYFTILYTGGPDGVSYLRALQFLSVVENWRWDQIGNAFIFAAIALGDFSWQVQKWVVVLLFLACLGSIASYIAYIVGGVTSNNGLSNKAILAGSGLNVTMNIMITFLIETIQDLQSSRLREAREPPP
ncbi:hypothetical protein BKA70DRAFT_1223380 [Coprinopsis sp. MPI-PUGE-AT-0042]|nr:hypothetical protein BKA70DRAFT_1223380 [Coprinopsis sp. MPI-PUGE-AT-0042]